MYRFLIIYISILFNPLLFAQENPLYEPMDFKPMVDKQNIKSTALVQGDVVKIKAFVESKGGKFKFAHGNIASVHLPYIVTRELEMKPWVKLIEFESNRIRPLSDTMLINNNITPLHNGISPFNDTTNGEGVIIGFLDTGVDFNHDDFKDSNGNSRILSIWDHNDSSDANRIPSKYGYGQVWTNSDIDGGICTHDDPSNYYGHGTMAVGVAAGNGLASNEFIGVAPKSDIVVVAMNFDAEDFNSSVADAIDYIFEIADSLGKPCVINTSVGEYTGSHDGSDLSAQIIDTMIKAKNGRIVVASAGNAGHIPYHLKVDIDSDTTFTCFEPYYYSSSLGDVVYIDQLYGDIDSLKDAYFSIACHRNDNAFTKIGTSNYIKIGDLNLSTGPNAIYNVMNVNSNNGGNTIATSLVVLRKAGINEDKYYLQFFNYGDSVNNNYKFSLSSTGIGLFDLWSHLGLTGSSTITTAIPDSAQYPEFKRYAMPDLNSTLVSSWQCLSSVTTVANYTNRMTWLDYNGILQTQASCGYSPNTPGKISHTSSLGPTRNGILKPDITASGDFTYSSARLATAASFASSNTCKLAPTGKHTRNGGTSTSSPVVAGVAALFLQRFPNANHSQFQHHLKNTANADNYTGTVPNNQWGFGKLNAFELIKNVCPTINISALTTNVSCNGLSNGSVSINISGGTNPYNIDLGTADTNALSAGNYNILVIDSNGCTKSDSFMITEPDLLILDTIVNQLICHGDTNGSISISVSGGYGLYDFLWSNNANDSIITNLGSGAYSVTVYDDNSCSDSLEIVITEPDELVLNIGNDTTICSNESFTINIPSFDSILWNTGVNSTNLQIIDSGTFSVIVLDSLMCSAYDTINVFYDSAQNVQTGFIYYLQNDSVFFTDTSLNADQYKWYFGDGDSSSQTNPIHHYDSSGMYYVLLESRNQCFADSSGQWIHFIMTGMIDNQQWINTLYPNPSRDMLFINLKKSALQPLVLKIYNNFGQLLRKENLSNTMEGHIKIDISTLPQGHYMLSLEDETKGETIKFIIN